MAERHAIVVGGGIGGLAAAVALHRQGWQVTVLERAPELGEVGAGLTLMANALRALDALGVGTAVRSRGVPDTPGGLRTSTGRWLSRVDAADMTRLLGTTALGIHRAELHRILCDALPSGALRTGSEVTGVDPDTGEVGVRGSAGLRADVVVGADGLRSVLRGALWPDTPPPVYSGTTAWRAVAAAPGPVPTAISWGRGTEFGMVPIGGDRLYWFAALSAPPGMTVPDELAAVRERFGDWHDPIPALLATTPPEAVIRTDLYHLATPLPSYVRGRVALLGDAAHAMTPNLGQGAGQALEDAVVLGAVCAGATGDDVPAALAAYDRERRPRSQEIARASFQMGRFGQQLHHPVAVAARNTLIRLTPARASLRGMARYAAWQPPAPA